MICKFTEEESKEIVIMLTNGCIAMRLSRKPRRNIMQVANKFHARTDVNLKPRDKALLVDFLAINITAIANGIQDMVIEEEKALDECCKSHRSYTKLYEKLVGVKVCQ